MAEEHDLSNHMQDSICFLAIMSSNFLKLIKNFVRPTIFSADEVHWVVRACYKYHDLTKEAPKDHLCDVLDDEIKGLPQTKKELIYHFIERISAMRNPNEDYVITKLNDFVKSREFETAAVDFVKLVDKKKFQDAELLMFNALRAGISKQNVGCDYFSDFSSLYRSEADEVLCTMGLEYFDCYRKFKRGELGIVLGGYKGKKSWSLHHIGKEALLRGLNVLHISHENSQELCERRYDRMIGSLAKHELAGQKIPVNFFDKTTNRLGVTEQIRPSEYDIEARKKARAVIQKFGGRLIIRKYPMGSCDMRELERYLDYLETFEGFVPDVLLNDYADIQKPMDSTKQTRDQLNETYIYHKRLADERNMLVVTPSQATREAIRAKRLTMKDFSEDVRKLANCDWTIAICQTDAQAGSSVATLYVVAARDGVMDVGCGVVQNLDIGQFASSSFPMKFGVSVAEEEAEAK